MNQLLATAMPGLFRALANHAEGMGGAMRRLEIGKKGNLCIEWESAELPTWLSWDGENLEPLNPSRDRNLPAAHLSDHPDVDLVSYRPNKRMVLLDRRTAVPHIIKAFRPRRFAGIANKYQEAHYALTGRGIQTPDIVDFDIKSASLSMLYDTGESLQLGSDNLDSFHLLGECLAEFQVHRAREALPDHSSLSELKILEQKSTRLASARLPLPDGWTTLQDDLQAAQEQLPDAVTGLCHRDLHDKQVIQHPHFLTLLDFDLLCHADVALDVANFLAHVRLRELQGVREATISSTYACGKRLLAGLGRNQEPGFWERLRYYQATTFARLALLYLLRPRWNGLCGDLVTLGQRCLEDLQRVREYG